jgi:hypothetical protein
MVLLRGGRATERGRKQKSALQRIYETSQPYSRHFCGSVLVRMRGFFALAVYRRCRWIDWLTAFDETV